MTRALVPSAVILAALTACANVDIPPYYEGGAAPVIDGIEPAVEQGNLGGATITVNGSNLGTDPADLVVTIGGHNAVILEANNSNLVLQTPAGPLSGGLVDVVVATANGYAWNEDAYEYDVVLGDEASPYTDQTAFISVQNLYASCQFGLWDHATDAAAGVGCGTISGSTGITGSSEWWKSPWPRAHVGEVGWAGTPTDFTPLWQIQEVPESGFVMGYDEIRYRVGEFYLENPEWRGESVCVDPSADPVDNEASCADDASAEYDLDKLRFCESFDPADGGTRRYAADWNVGANFFASDADEDIPTEPVDIIVHVEDIDPDLELKADLEAEVRLPGAMIVTAKQGFGDDETDQALWGVTGGVDSCLDGDGDGSARLDEDGIVLQWAPIEEPEKIGGDDVTASSTWVHVSITYLPIGWFGGFNGGLRASVVVPDSVGEIGIPNSVLYQFPTPTFDSYAGVNEITGVGHLGTWESGASYLIFEVYRFTDLQLANDATRTNVVLSYATGDIGFVTWDNPTERGDDCDDCIDGDDDGWVDAKDPDCMDGGAGTEANKTSASSCNDGIDNNDDGVMDADDSLCEDGADGEFTCDDDADNDEDGWIDGLDSECITGEQEAGDDDPSATCSNGLDDDGDGWIDGEDPACTKGADPEDDGFGTNACNDGEDNDGHGDVDADDPFCWSNGADAVLENVAVAKSECANVQDDDDDGFIDAFDPDCELAPATKEHSKSWEVDENHPVVPECYDGIDNDLDGVIDGDDSSCWRGDLAFQGDGFLNDEAKDWGTGCTDGLDGDLDGWIDGNDPDCKAGSALTQLELGVGTTKCNNGLDDDLDGKTDAADERCDSAADNIEN
jgi:hypothetical protein